MTCARFVIELRPSRIYAAGICVLHLATYGLLWWAQLPRTIQVLLFALMILLGLRAWRHWRELGQWHGLILEGDRVYLTGVRGEIEASLGSGMLLGTWLLVLPLHAEAGKRLLPLLPDSTTPGDWRRLRVWMNCRPGCG